jgi:exopolysaccharide biosynthesis operon protein EpsL
VWKIAALVWLFSLSWPGYAQMTPEVVKAAPEDRIRPYVLGSLIYDDNLFRVADDDEALRLLGTTDTSDTIYSVAAGVNVDLEISRQRLLLDASVNRNYFDRFDFLDYTGADALALWRWEWGNLWSGEMGYRYERTLSGFTEFQVPIRDIRTRQRVFASAVRKLTPRWQARVGADWTQVDFSEREQNERRRTTGELGLQYVSRANNVLGGELRFSSADFPNREGLMDNAYTETEIAAVGDWRFGGRSRAQFRAGYLNREHEVLSRRDFDGLVGRMDYLYQLTGKTSITASAWRELSSLNDEIATYAVVTGLGLEPRWDITSKVSLRAGAFYEDRDFQGETDITTADREDVYTFEVSVLYSPLRRVHLSLGYQWEERDSDSADREYEYQRILGALQFDF